MVKFSDSKCSACKGRKYTVDDGSRHPCAYCERTGLEPTEGYYQQRLREGKGRIALSKLDDEIEHAKSLVENHEKMEAMFSDSPFGKPGPEEQSRADAKLMNLKLKVAALLNKRKDLL